MLVFMETKFVGSGKVLCCGVNNIIAGVQFRRWKELGCVVVLLSDVWHSAVIDFRCVSSRIIWIKFRFSRVKVCGSRVWSQ